MKILLTGSEGFLGRNITIPCLRYNWNTTMDMVEVYNPDVIIHLAWEDIKERNNVEAQERSLKFVQTLEKHTDARWVVAGSQCEINTPNIPYAVYKTKAREYLEDRVPTIWVRIYSMFGEYDNPKNHIPMIINGCLRNEDIELTDQNILWDYLYVKEAARAFINLINAPEGIYELGSGKPVWTQKVALMIKDKTNSKSNLLFGKRPRREVEIDYLKSDLTKITPYWQPLISFEEGLDETIFFWKNV
jgi:nucleoside-diphosphate-sugar epimerase